MFPSQPPPANYMFFAGLFCVPAAGSFSSLPCSSPYIRQTCAFIDASGADDSFSYFDFFFLTKCTDCSFFG